MCCKEIYSKAGLKMLPAHRGIDVAEGKIHRNCLGPAVIGQVSPINEDTQHNQCDQTSDL